MPKKHRATQPDAAKGGSSSSSSLNIRGASSRPMKTGKAKTNKMVLDDDSEEVLMKVLILLDRESHNVDAGVRSSCNQDLSTVRESLRDIDLNSTDSQTRITKMIRDEKYLSRLQMEMKANEKAAAKEVNRQRWLESIRSTVDDGTPHEQNKLDEEGTTERSVNKIRLEVILRNRNYDNSRHLQCTEPVPAKSKKVVVFDRSTGTYHAMVKLIQDKFRVHSNSCCFVHLQNGRLIDSANFADFLRTATDGDTVEICRAAQTQQGRRTSESLAKRSHTDQAEASSNEYNEICDDDDNSTVDDVSVNLQVRAAETGSSSSNSEFDDEIDPSANETESLPENAEVYLSDASNYQKLKVCLPQPASLIFSGRPENPLGDFGFANSVGLTSVLRRKQDEADNRENLALMRSCQKSLPVYSRQEEIVNTVKNNQVTIIYGKLSVM
jgi:hypothetical protein